MPFQQSPDAVKGVRSRCESETPIAVDERIFLGSGLNPDTAAPVISRVDQALNEAGTLRVRARIHDRKSPTMPHDWQSVTIRRVEAGADREAPMTWYGEHLWFAEIPARTAEGASHRVCAVDAAGNETCSEPL